MPSASPSLLTTLLLVLSLLLASGCGGAPKPVGASKNAAARARRSARTAASQPATPPSAVLAPAAATTSDLPSTPASDEKPGSVQSPLRALREGVAQDPHGPAAIPPPKIGRYCQRLFARYDTDQNGELKFEEWSLMRGTPELADANHDGRIVPEELQERVARYSLRRSLRLSPLARIRQFEESAAGAAAGSVAPADASEAPAESRTRAAASRRFHVPEDQLPQGLAKWFAQRDSDGDGQLTLAEFAPELNEADANRFAQYDLDRDGILTPHEYLASQAAKAKPTASAPAAQPAADTAAAAQSAGGDAP